MVDTALGEPTPFASAVGRDVDDAQRAALLEQFYLTLSVTYVAAGPRAEPSALHDKIDRLFAAPQSWRNAYEIEQLLCLIMTPQQLETELNRRLAEAKALKIEYVDTIDKELHEDTRQARPESGVAYKRIVLHRLLNDLQWFYTKRVQHRAASQRLMQRVSLLFIAALVTLFLVLFIQFFAQARLAAPAARSAPAGAATTAPNGAQAVTTGEPAPPAEPDPAPAQADSTTQTPK